MRTIFHIDYLVQFIGPIKPEWLQAVEKAGGILREPLPSFAYVVELSDAAYEAVKNLDFVRWIGYFEPNLRVSPDLRQSLEEPASRGVGPQIAKSAAAGAWPSRCRQNHSSAPSRFISLPTSCYSGHPDQSARRQPG